MEEKLPTVIRPLSAEEQAVEGLVRSAKIIRSYYDALVAVGFSKPEALQLVTNWQATITRGTVETTARHDPS